MIDFKGKKVLVTGSAGFIGSHLVESLAKDGAEVTCLVRYTSHKSLGNLVYIAPDLKSELKFIFGDIRDGSFIRSMCGGQDYVFNLAALIGIPYSYVAPQSYIDVNVLGTLNILNAALDHGCKVIQTSTSECYGTAEFVPMGETHPLKAQSPYAASKIGADQLALSFNKSFGLPVTILRPFNTYGPRQSSRAVIPTIIRQAMESPEIALGNIEAVRDMNYVTDTVRAFKSVAISNESVGKILNSATGVGYSIRDILEVVGKLLNRELVVKPNSQDRLRPQNSEVYELIGDATNLSELTGWTPLVELHSGLQKTIEFAESFPAFESEAFSL